MRVWAKHAIKFALFYVFLLFYAVFSVNFNITF